MGKLEESKELHIVQHKVSRSAQTRGARILAWSSALENELRIPMKQHTVLQVLNVRQHYIQENVNKKRQQIIQIPTTD